MLYDLYSDLLFHYIASARLQANEPLISAMVVLSPGRETGLWSGVWVRRQGAGLAPARGNKPDSPHGRGPARNVCTGGGPPRTLPSSDPQDISNRRRRPSGRRVRRY